MIGDVANDSDNKDWRVLLVDKESMRIINASCRMYDVMERGITGNAREFLLPFLLIKWCTPPSFFFWNKRTNDTATY